MQTPNRRAKKILVACCAAIGTLAAFALLLSLVFPVNLGLPFGYYGEWNRTLAEFRRIPDVEVLSQTANLDTVLEEMWFDIAYAKRTEMHVFIPQTMNSDELFHSFGGVYMDGIKRFISPDDFEQILGYKISNLAEFIRASPEVLSRTSELAERIDETDYDVHKEQFSLIYNLREYGSPDPWDHLSSR